MELRAQHSTYTCMRNVLENSNWCHTLSQVSTSGTPIGWVQELGCAGPKWNVLVFLVTLSKAGELVSHRLETLTTLRMKVHVRVTS